MKHLFTRSAARHAAERANIIIWCLVMVTVVSVAGGVAMLVAQSSQVTLRRGQMIQALQYAQGAVVIACNDLNQAILSTNATFVSKMQNGPYPYTALSSTMFQRTVAAPFSNQTATVRIVVPSVSGALSAAITGSATVGDVTQTATGNVKMGWAYPGAIISVNAGTTATGNGKSVGQDGNVAINGGNSGPIIVNGGPSGLAVLANGQVNYDTNYLNPPAAAYSMTNWGTANQIPDYTSQGTVNALFDLDRFIAVADLTPGGYAPSGNNHFTNIATFITAMLQHTNSATAMQGVVVVDLSESDKNLGNLKDNNLPAGMNVNGTLLFNFTGPGWDPVSEKIIVTAAFNINAADLSGLVPNNPATYATGYPPIYTDSAKNPANIDITSKGYQNFSPSDDLPALIYSTGCLDMHGNCNICGVLYTPCYIELENKQSGQTQYINGCVICGHGMYYENNQKSTSIVSFDPNTVDSLATWGNVGKQLAITYWSP
jgi:hypothetical protein